MFRSLPPPCARFAVILPLLALASCGGSNTGAVITVPNSVIVADLNGDGVNDVAVASAQIDETGISQKPGLLATIMNSKTSPGTFASQTLYSASPVPPSGLAVGDLSGTGTHDLVVANINAGTLSVFMETSATSGSYSAAKTISIGGQPNDVQVADLNGDGLPDLVVADNLGKVTYLIQTSPGTFATGVSLPITNRAISVAVGDLNGDGLPDLAVSSFDLNGDFGLVTVYYQDPAHPGSFLATPLVITAYGEPSQIRIADMNQDGSNDIVVACQGLGANASIYADPSTVSFAEAQFGAMVILQNSATPGTFGTPTIYTGLSGAISLTIADLNNDGLPDIAMASLYPQGEGYIGTLMQVPSAPGTFGAVTTILGVGQPVSIAAGDMDGDGLIDLVTADATSAYWYKNQSSAPGTFIGQVQLGL